MDDTQLKIVGILSLVAGIALAGITALELVFLSIVSSQVYQGVNCQTGICQSCLAYNLVGQFGPVFGIIFAPGVLLIVTGVLTLQKEDEVLETPLPAVLSLGSFGGALVVYIITQVYFSLFSSELYVGSSCFSPVTGDPSWQMIAGLFPGLLFIGMGLAAFTGVVFLLACLGVQAERKKKPVRAKPKPRPISTPATPVTPKPVASKSAPGASAPSPRGPPPTPGGFRPEPPEPTPASAASAASTPTAPSSPSATPSPAPTPTPSPAPSPAKPAKPAVPLRKVKCPQCGYSNTEGERICRMCGALL